jgi:hypothetical protein
MSMKNSGDTTGNGTGDLLACSALPQPTVPLCARKVCAVAPDICGFCLWNLLHVTLLSPRILTWLLDFWKICAPVQ